MLSRSPAPTMPGKLPWGPAAGEILRTSLLLSHPIKQRVKTSCQEDEKGVWELPLNAKILGFSDTDWGAVPRQWLH